MFTFLTHAGAALLVPALLAPGPRTECQLDRLTYVSADERAVGRFIAATHDYAAYSGSCMPQRGRRFYGAFIFTPSGWICRENCTCELRVARERF
jgi:hypothetical protein